MALRSTRVPHSWAGQRRGEILDLRHTIMPDSPTRLFPLQNRTRYAKEIQKATPVWTLRHGRRCQCAAKRRPDGESANRQHQVLTAISLTRLIPIRLSPSIPWGGRYQQPMSLHRAGWQTGVRDTEIKNTIESTKTNLKTITRRISVMALGERNQKLIKEWIKTF